MERIRSYVLGFVFLLIVCTTVEAQHNTVYSNYVYNKLLINPAYVGSEKFLSASIAFKKNWVGVEGSPASKLFLFHAPLRVKKIALGLIVTDDEFGVTNETNIQAVYSYRLYMSKHVLSFGLQPTATFYAQRFSQLKGVDPNDPNFQGQDINDVAFNLGFGTYLYHEKYYVGLSIPRAASNLLVPQEDEGVNVYEQQRYFLLHNGFLLDLNQRLKFQPNVFLKFTTDLPLQIDLNTTLILDEKMLFGLSLQRFNTLETNIGFQINNLLMFSYSYGYGFDIPNDISNGAHEVMLKYSFKRSSNRYMSTRYF
ncbi:PorP/SprF family type IX secretion system membrane protein [Reichenbachiella versicolor]|uniref:PorP/SprF family type IX secretion system membrane protein n=1 Tax=Reichenbachiella versicolor TaxID=1821036 RepID=UPI000D6E954A|nr:PorP/SprF family type IX secretion system membrane protein [Reichenbachiella versicolor]